jgi:hypothetical protein
MATTTVENMGFWDEVKRETIMVMVKNGLRAAIEPGAYHIVDRVTKVEMRTENKPDRFALTLTLFIWWELEDGEFHVTKRDAEICDGQTGTIEDVLMKLTNFEPEEVLKFAAFV